MPVKVGDRNVLSWATDLDHKTIAQASRTAAMPFVSGHLALMPDAHLGLGATIGSVIPTDGAIIPAAVGVDIGCGMIAVETSLTTDDLPDHLGSLHSNISRSVPAGVGRGHSGSSSAGSIGETWFSAHPNESVTEFSLGSRAVNQLGSLGSGNHFVEVCLDPAEHVWVVLHSGSRGVGNQLAQRHIKTAKAEMKRMFIGLEDPDLAYFVEGTNEFEAYIRDLMWAQEYALANREQMMDEVLTQLMRAVFGGREMEPGRPPLEKQRINCHHNYSAKEHHHGRYVWITRKGAIRAREGDLGVIPGSMGTSSYIVRGLGNPASYHSSAHGAGRRMSRTQAKRQFDVEGLTKEMRGVAWNAAQAGRLLDEHPGSYKDIDRVMAEQADLVEIVVPLVQVLNYKGT